MAGVIRESRGLSWEKRRFVGGDRSIIAGVCRGVASIPGGTVVKHVSSQHRERRREGEPIGIIRQRANGGDSTGRFIDENERGQRGRSGGVVHRVKIVGR